MLTSPAVRASARKSPTASRPGSATIAVPPRRSERAMARAILLGDDAEHASELRLA